MCGVAQELQQQHSLTLWNQFFDRLPHTVKYKWPRYTGNGTTATHDMCSNINAYSLPSLFRKIVIGSLFLYTVSAAFYVCILLWGKNEKIELENWLSKFGEQGRCQFKQKWLLHQCTKHYTKYHNSHVLLYCVYYNVRWAVRRKRK